MSQNNHRLHTVWLISTVGVCFCGQCLWYRLSLKHVFHIYTQKLHNTLINFFFFLFALNINSNIIMLQCY